MRYHRNQRRFTVFPTLESLTLLKLIMFLAVLCLLATPCVMAKMIPAQTTIFNNLEYGNAQDIQALSAYYDGTGLVGYDFKAPALEERLLGNIYDDIITATIEESAGYESVFQKGTFSRTVYDTHTALSIAMSIIYENYTIMTDDGPLTGNSQMMATFRNDIHSHLTGAAIANSDLLALMNDCGLVPFRNSGPLLVCSETGALNITNAKCNRVNGMVSGGTKNHLAAGPNSNNHNLVGSIIIHHRLGPSPGKG